MLERPSILMRIAGDDDLPAILALYAQPEIDDGDVLSVEEAKDIFARFAHYPDYALYVAALNGAIVGSFALLVMDNLGHLGAKSAVIEDVVVDPAVHGQGIGQAMMRFAIAQCREKGCYKVALSSNAKRERAHAFYEQLGFARHGYSFRMELDGKAS